MKLSATEEGALALEEIPPFFFQVLEEIVTRGASGDSRVEDRFYPAPAEDPLLAEDWMSLVRPELQDLFLSARETVQNDLKTAYQKGDSFFMEIPPDHMDAWLNALNQARLAIAEENHFEEKDLSGDVSPDPEDPRTFALFQISFYGFLQECLVRMQD